ncbi:MAG: c-type cytochrome [Anaeromyxobacteraceae bacterium]
MRRALAAAALAAIVACRASPPGKLERAAAARLKRTLFVGGRGDVNPLVASAQEIERGRRAFAAYCIVCHGLDAQNTGVPFAAAMAPPVPPLTSPDVQAYSDGQLRWIIANGLFPSGMPAARDLLSDEEIWRIVLWLRHLPPAGSLGEPAVYSGGEPATPP